MWRASPVDPPGYPPGDPLGDPPGVPQEIPTHPNATLVASDLVFTHPLTAPISYPAVALTGQMTKRLVNYLSVRRCTTTHGMSCAPANVLVLLRM